MLDPDHYRQQLDARLARNRGVDPEASKFQPSYFTSSSGEKLLRLRGGAELSAEKLAEKSAAEKSEAAANQKKYADAVERDLESTVSLKSVLAAAGGIAWFTFVTFPGWLKPDLKPSMDKSQVRRQARGMVYLDAEIFQRRWQQFPSRILDHRHFQPDCHFLLQKYSLRHPNRRWSSPSSKNLAVTQIYVVAKTGTYDWWLLPIEWVQIVGKVLGAWGALTNGADFTSTATAFVLCELGYEAKIIKNTDAMQKSKGKKGNLIEQGGIDQTPV